LKGTGITDVSYWGPELEFYVFDDVRYDQTAFTGYYRIDSDEGIWNTG
jgi:glutamine synthetase